MKLKELSQEELENMSYDDLAYLILEENGKKMKLMDIFKKIAKLLDMNDSEIEMKIADFFEVMSTNKQFVMLDKGYWDLSNKHMKNVVIEDEDEIDEESEEIDDDIEVIDDDDKDIYYDNDDDDVDDDDDLSDLVIIDSEEETSLD